MADWLHRTVAGLSPDSPGYRRIRIAPRPGGGLTSASATLDTPLGAAFVRWHVQDDQLVLDALVPDGSTAVVDLPGQ